LPAGVGDARSGGADGVGGGESSETGRVGLGGGELSETGKLGVGSGVRVGRTGGLTVKVGVGSGSAGTVGDGSGPKRSAAKLEVVVRTIAENAATPTARMDTTTAALAFPRLMPAATGGLVSPTALTLTLIRETRQPPLACLHPHG
jgi:hypothetical protein